jgi:hypothetical protein
MTLQLANGVVIDTNTGIPIAPTIDGTQAERREKPSRRTATNGRDRTNKEIRLNVADLPADPRALNTVGIVYVYYMLGLADHDIADCTGLRLDQVEHIKGMQLFERLGSMIITNAGKIAQADTRARIEQMSSVALDAIEDIIDDREVEASVKLRASQDMLDRAGFGAKQITEHHHKMSGGLTIRMIDDTESTSTIPTIDIDREGAEDAQSESSG